jgi:hypothetical protein
MNQIPASALGTHRLRRLAATELTNHAPALVVSVPDSAFVAMVAPY